METEEQKKQHSKNYVEYTFYFLLLLIVVGTFFSFKSGGYSLVVIVNEDLNSMYPTYYQGDIFIIKQKLAIDIQVGDVVVYRNDVSGGTLIIHRVIEVIPINVNGVVQYYYRVKGDNPVDNSVPDNTKYSGGVISYDMIKGVVVKRIAWFGTISLVKSDTTHNGFLIYVSLVIGILALLFWPENKEEQKKSYTLKDTWQYLRSNLKPDTTKKKLLGLFSLLFLIFLMLGSLWAVGYASYASTGKIVDVTQSPYITYTSNVDGRQISRYYLQLSVEIEVSMAPNKAMLVIQAKTFDGAEIGYMIWKTLRPIFGDVTVGIGIVYNTNIAPQSVSFVVSLYLSRGGNYELIQTITM